MIFRCFQNQRQHETSVIGPTMSYDVRVYPKIVREVHWILQHERKCTLAL